MDINDFMNNDSLDEFVESLSNLIDEEFTLKKPERVIFNTDVVNNCDSIFFPNPNRHNFFELIKFHAPAWIELPRAIQNGYEYITKNYAYYPPIVFIPFAVYGNFVASHNVLDYTCVPTVDNICKSFGLDYVVITPDIIKDKVKTVDYGKAKET